MNRPLAALVLCLIMVLMPLAGCVSQADVDSAIADHDADIADKQNTIDNLTTEVSELESQMLAQDVFITNLQSELSNVSSDYNTTLLAHYALQSEHASVQAQLASAEYNATAHESQIDSLETQLELANNHISLLNDLMSNTSNTTNESFAQMSNQMAQMNEHISNLSALLNYSTARHQENVTLVASLITQQSELSAELSNITNLLTVANLTISQLQNEIDQLSTVVVSESYFHGLLNGSERSTKFRDLDSVKLDPIHYGSPTLTIENQGFETYMNYSTSVNRSHSLWFELCNTSIGLYNSDWFTRALGINYTTHSNNGGWSISNYNSTTLLNLTFDWDGANAETTNCLVWSTTPNQNGSTNFVYPNFDLLSLFATHNREIELRVFACMQSGPDVCTSEHNWLERGSGNAEENYSYYGHNEYEGDFLHPIETGFAVPVGINDNSCLMNSSISGRTGCAPPDCISSFRTGGSSPCSIHIIDWGTGSGTYNYDLYNVTNLYADFGTGSSTHNIYICDSQFYADVSMSTGSNNVRIYSYGWGAGNNVTIDSSYNTGTLNGNGNRSVDYYMGVSSISLSVYEWADGAWSC